MNENPKTDFYSPPYYNEAGMLCYIPSGREDGLPIPLCTFASRIVKELIVDDGEKTVRHYLIGGTDPDGEEIEPVDVPANGLEKMHWIADNLDASCDLCIVPQVEKHVRCAIKTTARYAEKQYIFSHTGWKKIQGEWHFLMPEYDEECFVELKGKQRNYRISGEATDEDIRKVAGMLDSGIMPDVILPPCLALVFLSPLNEFLR